MANLGSLSNYYITAQEGFSTTLNGSIASGATTFTLNSTTGYADGDVVALVFEPASATAKQVAVGVKSGLTITNVVWTEGTNQSHASGVTVVDYTTATHQAAQTKGNLVHANPNGTLKTSAVTNALTAGTVSNNMIADDGVTDSKLINGKVMRRQGGNATDWSAVGTTNYDTSATDTKIQCGTIFNNANPKTITFPVPFTNPPLVIVNVSSVNATSCFATTPAVTATTFNCQVYDNAGNTNSNQNVNWIAIGI